MTTTVQLEAAELAQIVAALAEQMVATRRVAIACRQNGEHAAAEDCSRRIVAAGVLMNRLALESMDHDLAELGIDGPELELADDELADRSRRALESALESREGTA